MFEGDSRETLVFCYGTNGPDHLAGLLGISKNEAFVRSCPAVLHGHRRRFVGMSSKWGGGVATLAEAPGKAVHGSLFAMDPAWWAALDAREEHGKTYAKTMVEAHVEAGSVPPSFAEPARGEGGLTVFRASAYVVKDGSALDVPPSPAYLGAIRAHLATWWVGEDEGDLTPFYPGRL